MNDPELVRKWAELKQAIDEDMTAFRKMELVTLESKVKTITAKDAAMDTRITLDDKQEKIERTANEWFQKVYALCCEDIAKSAINGDWYTYWDVNEAPTGTNPAVAILIAKDLRRRGFRVSISARIKLRISWKPRWYTRLWAWVRKK